MTLDCYLKLNKSETSYYSLSVNLSSQLNYDQSYELSVLFLMCHHHTSAVSSGVIPAGDEDEAEGPVEEVDGEVQRRRRSRLWWGRQVRYTKLKAEYEINIGFLS